MTDPHFNTLIMRSVATYSGQPQPIDGVTARWCVTVEGRDFCATDDDILDDPFAGSLLAAFEARLMRDGYDIRLERDTHDGSAWACLGSFRERDTDIPRAWGWRVMYAHATSPLVALAMAWKASAAFKEMGCADD